MRLSACVTTMNATQDLDACLRALWNSRVKPYSVIVSDDSPEDEVQQKNRQVTERYPGTTYLTGPGSGLCANRNNAVNAVIETDLIAFIDDDLRLDTDFIARAIEQYNQMEPQQKNSTILSGVAYDGCGHESVPLKLSLSGYFRPTEIPEVVTLHAGVFPRSFFEQEQWDENIFIGQEDAELSMRALKQNYRILHHPELKVFDSGTKAHSLDEASVGSLTEYKINKEASRLYIGIKRYKQLFPNPWKLIAFIGLYSIRMPIYLLRQRSLKALPEIIRRSNIRHLLQSSPSGATDRKFNAAEDKALRQ
ncbi:MAG: glycosyltransferase [Cyanobacteria bacterium QH_9_48_43]|nr:MAG: glycosyltransferase [Cyanobacteria bacterium QH_9_48_43]